MIPQILDKCYIGQVGFWKIGLTPENWEPEFLKKAFMTQPHEKEMAMFIILCGYVHNYQWPVQIMDHLDKTSSTSYI